MPGPLTGFINGFQTQITADVLSSDTILNFPTAGMVRGLQYVIRLDDSNPPTTFEYALVQFRDSTSVNVIGGTAGRGYGGTAPLAHTQSPTSGFVTAVLLDESMRGAFARIDTENFMAFASASGISGQFFNVYGLPGATQPTRYVGATSGGAPVSGSFVTGDFALDTSNNILWICTSSGSPGTWQNILDGVNTGLTGAVSSITRWVGATGTGKPASGTWQIGDVVTDRSGSIWVCTAPGTPGTWVQLTPDASLGRLAYAQAVVAQAGINAETDLTSLSITFTASGRQVRLSAYCTAVGTVVNDVGALRIKEGGTQLTVAEGLRASGMGETPFGPSVVLTPTVGAHTYKLTFARSSGTGTWQVNGSATRPAYILAEDIGP